MCNYRIKALATLLSVFVLGVATALPAHAQGPKHTGPPDAQWHDRGFQYVFTPATCDGYDVEASVTADWDGRLWLADDGSRQLYKESLREDVTLTNTVTSKSVDLFLRWTVTFDYAADTSTFTGIRSAIVKPGGGLEELSNVGRVVLSGISWFGGDVLSHAGQWAAIVDGVMDHKDFACQLVAD